MRRSSIPLWLAAGFLLAEPAAGDLVAHWPFSEGSGASAADASGNGHHGSLRGAPVWAAGVLDGALEFAGDDDRVEVPDHAALDLDRAITIAAWMRPRERGTQYVVKKGRYGETDGYGLNLSGKGRVFVRFNQQSAGNDFKLLSSRPYPTDGATWMHAAATFDGEQIRLYLDGALEASLPAPGLAIAANEDPLSIGAQSDGLRPFRGAVDDVHLYDRALSSEEIQTLASAEPPPDEGEEDEDPDEGEEDDPGEETDPPVAHGEVGSWSFEEGGGSDALDASDLGNHGALVGAPARVPGRAGDALALDGAARVLVADAPSLDLATAITAAAWIRPTVQGTQYLLKKGRYGATDGYELDLSSSGEVFVRFNQASAGNAYRVSSSRSYPTDGQTWMHVAASFDGAEIRLYLDGVLEASRPAPDLSIAANDLPLSIGAQDDGVFPFEGALDEVRLFDSALGDSEIQALAFDAVPSDRDWDGVPDADDAFPDDPSEWADRDGDGVGDEADLDDDGDGMPDGWEIAKGFDPLDASDAAGDADGDGLDNLEEFLQGSDPLGALDAFLMGSWSFDEESGDAALDATAMRHDGLLVGSAERVPGVRGGALELAGGSSACAVAGVGSLRFDDHRVDWYLANSGETPVRIDRIAVAWPGANGVLKKVKLGGSTIFDRKRSPGSTVIESGWKGDARDREIESGRTERLRLEFDEDAVGAPQDYALSVRFAQGCEVEHGSPPSGGGDAGRVLVPDHASLDLREALTLAAWLRPAAAGPGVAIAKADVDVADGYELGIASGGEAYLHLNQASAGDSYRLLSADALPADGARWTHVAGTYDGSELRIYLNGVLENARFAPGLAIGRNGFDLSLGARHDGRDGFRGAIDEVRVFDVALGDAEIAALAGLAPTLELPQLEDWQHRALAARPTTISTGEKPQSKLWRFGGSWWAVFADLGGTWIWRLDADRWTRVLPLSAAQDVQADYALREADGLVHVLLFRRGQPAQLASAEYVPGFPGSYRPWVERPLPADVPLSAAAETAAVALDAAGRLWVAYDTATAIEVAHAGPADGYAGWSAARTLASGVTEDDIAAIAAFGGGVGVMWSDFDAQRFGFRFHRDGDDADDWSGDEKPGERSALDAGFGIADDHIHLAAAADGTLYAAVKTSYDTPGLPVIGLLVRRPSGQWDDLYDVAGHGTRPVVALNEALGSLIVMFSSDETGGDIEYRVADTGTLAFGPIRMLLSGRDLNNASTTRQSFVDELVVIASTDEPDRQLVGVALTAD